MAPAGSRTDTRAIARAAVRAELAQVALELFRQDGFDQVTINDLAKAAGVSRSTFLRCFGSKEEAVLFAFDQLGDQVAADLRNRPSDEDDWTALRRALDTAIQQYYDDAETGLAMTRLVQETPALNARSLEKQSGWRPALAQALAQRGGSDREATIADVVRATTALVCLNVALERWVASGGELDLVALIDEAFAAFSS